MSGKYHKGKRGAGRHVQLSEHLQSTEAWADLKPGPRALYIELKRRYNGQNNGRIILSHRHAANALNVNRNTVGAWFKELEAHELIAMIIAPHLGPEGVGKATVWALQECPTADGKHPRNGFRDWRKMQNPRQKNGTARPKKQDSQGETRAKPGATVLKIVTGT